MSSSGPSVFCACLLGLSVCAARAQSKTSIDPHHWQSYAPDPTESPDLAAEGGGEPSRSQPDSIDEPDVSPPIDPTNAIDAAPQATIDRLLQRYAHEPNVEQVVGAALRAARNNPQKYAELASRARWRGLLPHVDLGARRGQGIDLRWTPTEDLEAHRTTADDVTLFATLRFDLDRLVFTGEEVSLAREARNARNAEHQLIRAVVRVYFLRRRLMLERDLLDGRSIAQLLRIQEAEALLDAFTDGAFQRMLKASKSKAWRTGASTNASGRR